MDLSHVFAIVEVVVGLAMAILGAWQYVVSAPLPGALGRPIRSGQDLQSQPPQRWQTSGGAIALFGAGFVLFGVAVLLEGSLSGSALGALRALGLLAWIGAIVLTFIRVTRYRSN